MALLLPKSIFIHCSKTGGWWIRNVIKLVGTPTSELGHEHTSFRSGLLKLHDVEWYRKRIAFTFVRHPLSWYQSLWAFRLKHGWSMIHPLDFHCGCNHFPTFVERALEKYPEGWVTKLYDECTYTPGGVRMIVGRQEHLRRDFHHIINMVNEDIPLEASLDVPAANTSDMDGRSSAALAVYPPGLAACVLKVERSVVDRWYYPGWEDDLPQ